MNKEENTQKANEECLKLLTKKQKNKSYVINDDDDNLIFRKVVKNFKEHSN